MKRSRKRTLVLVGVVLLAVLTVFWATVINEPFNKARRDVERNVKKFVRSGATAAHMRDIAPHDWQKVYAFGSGGAAAAGRKWSGPDCLGETHWGLLFVDPNGGEVYVCVARRVVDGPPSAGPGCVLNEGAVARIVPKPGGAGTYLVIQGPACLSQGG